MTQTESKSTTATMRWLSRVAFRLAERLDSEQHPAAHDQRRRDDLWSANFVVLSLMEQEMKA